MGDKIACGANAMRIARGVCCVRMLNFGCGACALDWQEISSRVVGFFFLGWVMTAWLVSADGDASIAMCVM